MRVGGDMLSDLPIDLCFTSHCSTLSLPPSSQTCMLYHVYLIMHAVSNKKIVGQPDEEALMLIS